MIMLISINISCEKSRKIHQNRIYLVLSETYVHEVEREFISYNMKLKYFKDFDGSIVRVRLHLFPPKSVHQEERSFCSFLLNKAFIRLIDANDGIPWLFGMPHHQFLITSSSFQIWGETFPRTSIT